MRRTLMTAAAAAALALGAARSGLPARLSAQAPSPTGATGDRSIPRMPDGHPDLSGVWWFGTDVPLRPLSGEDAAPQRQPDQAAVRRAFAPRPSFPQLYQPWAKEKARTLSDKDDPSLRCIPVAFGTLNVSLFGTGAVGQIVQTPKFVVLLTETYHGFKIIPTDGRPHRDDVAPSFRGDSVGRWEGDTLVVDTTNFTDTNWMHAEGLVSFHSDALHIVERYRRVDRNTLEVDATIEDPKVLTGPWIVPTQRLQLAPFDQIMEIGCTGTETTSLMEAAAKQNYGKKQ
jgi:hypothetical protein